MAMQPHYVLHARSYGVAVSAGINGSTTLYDDTGEGKSFYRPINEWILPEKNLLTGLIFLPPGGALPDGTVAGGTDAFVHLELIVAGPDGMPNTDVPALGEFHWPGVGPAVVLPTSILQPAAIGAKVDTRLWQQAEPVETLNESDQASIAALVNDLTHALVAQDQLAIMRLLDYRFDDEARARAQDPAAVKSSAMKLAQNFARFNKSPPPLTRQSALFTPAAGGRAWHVQRGWMKPAIFFEDEDMEFSIEIYASRIGGQWIISRG